MGRRRTMQPLPAGQTPVGGAAQPQSQRQTASQGKGRWGGMAPLGGGKGGGKGYGKDNANPITQTQQRRDVSGGAINPTPQRKPHWFCTQCQCCENWASNPRCHSCNAARMHATNPGQRVPQAQQQQEKQQQQAQQQPRLQQQQQAQQQQQPAPAQQQQQAAPLQQGHAPGGAGAAAHPAPPPGPPPDEATALRAALKVKKEWLKAIEAISAAHPMDEFTAQALGQVNTQIQEISVKLDALRPPEARLSQCISALNNRSKTLHKLQAELATVDAQRSALLLQVQEASQEVASFQAQLDELKAGAPPPPPTDHMTALELLLQQMGVPNALPTFKQALQGMGVDTAAPPPPPPPVPGPAADAAMPQCATAPRPFGPAPQAGAAPAFTATARVSPFPLAADRAAIERARVLFAAAEAAQAASAGAYAHAAVITQQAAQANAEATAAAQAAAARAAAVAADARAAKTAADEEVAATAKRRRTQGGRARSLSRSHGSSQRSASGRRTRASRSPRRSSPDRTAVGSATPPVH